MLWKGLHGGCRWLRRGVGLLLLVATAAGAEGRGPKGRAASPRKRVLVLGDSFVVSAFGVTLERLLAEHPELEGARRGKSSSGLARPDFFDWFGEGRRLVARYRPDLVVVIMGGNDGQDLVPWAGKRRVHWGSPGWPAAYRERVVAFVKAVRAPGRKVLWLGLPPMGPRRFEKKVEYIRKLQREALRDLEDVSYVDTRPLLTDARGRLLPTVPSSKGGGKGGRKKGARIRDPDGVHFTVAGGQFFAREVWPALLAKLGVKAAPARGASPRPPRRGSSAGPPGARR